MTTEFTTAKGNLLIIEDNGGKFSRIAIHTTDGKGAEALLLNGKVITGSRRKRIIESAYKEYLKSIN